ncbi:hypothetical protein HD594_001913 [Microbacterium thalassium]|uniref:PD(D/E)XK endonuclease domain-containing protein n=1 Tax=Microbacterium thalassium TaxID=362649 RepID=A0A7X0FR00_9MICO|nr:hypothetical protein [Microbacterium thalassium]
MSAVASARSWRGVLRQLGLLSTSAGAMRSVRAHADRLGISYEHFTGRRRWVDEELRQSIAEASDWHEAARSLDGAGEAAIAALQGHAARLGVDSGHLAPREAASADAELRPDTSRLDRAGSLLAAAWYTMCGCDVSWPLEPSRYDLVISSGGEMRRVQVKTTTTRAAGTWKAYLSTSRSARRPYSPDEIDEFFVIDGDLAHYVIPLAAVGGLHAIHLSAYARFRVAGLPVGGR